MDFLQTKSNNKLKLITWESNALFMMKMSCNYFSSVDTDIE